MERICWELIATDPDGDDIYYWIERETTQERGWDGPYSSDTPIERTYIWSKQGTYTISCKTKDVFDLESEWGELEVTMPKNKAINTPFLNFL